MSSSSAGVDSQALIVELTRKVLDRYPSVIVETEGTSTSTTIHRFRVTDPSRVQISVAATGADVSVLTEAVDDGFWLEHSGSFHDVNDVESLFWGQIVPAGDDGLETVRTISWLGSFSPSWQGAPTSPEIVRAKSHRHAEVIVRVDGWR